MNIRTIIILFIAVLLSTIFVSEIMGKSRVELKREQTRKECKLILKANKTTPKYMAYYKKY